jgi:sigma-B regulation protein RsbU (phosphoserine phosphatase)
LKDLEQNPEQHELELQKLQLYWLLQITKAINYNLPSSNLYEIYNKVTSEHLKLGRLSLIVHNNNRWEEKVSFGLNIPTCEDDIADISDKATIFESLGSELTEWMYQFETIIPVMHKERPLAYALIGKVEGSVFINKREATSFLHTITNVITVAIENKRLAKESIRQAAVNRELELAAEMQSMLFPTDLNIHGFMDVAATYIPHQQVGGDYYDFIKLNDDEAVVCMADVSGKGISAALLMSNFQANLRAYVNGGMDIEEVVFRLNDRVNHTAKGERFVTFFIARINKITREIRYVNAGHHPPMLVKGNNSEVLKNGTTGLGMFEELPFLNVGRTNFPAGSVLFLYTDGITEMENNSGDALGEDKLLEILQQNLELPSMNDLHEKMLQIFDVFTEDSEFTDDVTFLSCRFLI